MTLDLDYVRSQFPGLATTDVLFDNAGGSVALIDVADRVRDYLLHTSVQIGAGYSTSQAAAERYRSARQRLAEFIGASRAEEVVFGPSTTILLKFLASAMAEGFGVGDELVVTRVDHESNIGCWLEIAEARGATIRFWERNADTGELSMSDLEGLLTDRTRLVAVTHVSNIFGTIHPIEAIAARVHACGARLCVDGVAYAPHRQLQLAAWNVDFYVFSLYKVYGPHHGLLYGRHDALLELGSVNHHFFTREQVPGKLEPGNANYELSYGAAGIVDYFDRLGQRAHPTLTGANAREMAWRQIAAHEEALSERLLAYLRDREDIEIIGRAQADAAMRVPTISFVHQERRSSEIVRAVGEYGIGVRFGHFYAVRLIEDLGLLERDGVVRVSMVHYNTLDEVERLLNALDAVL